MTTGKPNEEQMGELFGLTVKLLMEKLNDGTATSSDMNNIRNILKDNGITVDTSREGHSLSGLHKKALPDLPDDPNIIPMKK